MKKVCLLALILFSIAGSVHGYPISPRPLRKLVMESEYIIIGNVVKVYEGKRKKDDYQNTIARIVIIEQLQGKITQNTIEVPFAAGMICPAPAMYYEGTRVLAFLRKDKGTYYTHALSYGTKTLGEDQLAVYKDRIREIQLILTNQYEEQRFYETVEWLVKCAENEATRWEGVFELSPESDFMSYYSQEKGEGYGKALNSQQKERLRTALIKSAEIDYPDFGLVDIVYPEYDKEVEVFLISSLRKLKEDDFWLLQEFISRLAHRAPSREMEKLEDEYRSIRFEYKKLEEKKVIMQKFIALIDPDVKR